MFFLKKASSFLNNSHAEKDRVRKDQNIRCFILQFIFIALFSILIHRLFVLQIVNGQKYAEDFELQITRTIREHNTRGNIYDCNGEVLAYNELVYTVTMIDDGTYASERERQLSINSVIYCVMKKLNEKYLNEFSMNVWTAEDVKEIIMQLELDKKIYTCAFPWKGKIDCTESRSSASIKKITLKKKDFLPQRLLHQADLLAQKELPVS